MPEAIFVNTPAGLIVPSEVFELAQVPPVDVLLNVVVVPVQTAVGPPIAEGVGFTETDTGVEEQATEAE